MKPSDKRIEPRILLLVNPEWPELVMDRCCQKAIRQKRIEPRILYPEWSELVLVGFQL